MSHPDPLDFFQSQELNEDFRQYSWRLESMLENRLPFPNPQNGTIERDFMDGEPSEELPPLFKNTYFGPIQRPRDAVSSTPLPENKFSVPDLVIAPPKRPQHEAVINPDVIQIPGNISSSIWTPDRAEVIMMMMMSNSSKALEKPEDSMIPPPWSPILGPTRGNIPDMITSTPKTKTRLKRRKGPFDNPSDGSSNQKKKRDGAQKATRAQGLPSHPQQQPKVPKQQPKALKQQLKASKQQPKASKQQPKAPKHQKSLSVAPTKPAPFKQMPPWSPYETYGSFDTSPECSSNNKQFNNWGMTRPIGGSQPIDPPINNSLSQQSQLSSPGLQISESSVCSKSFSQFMEAFKSANEVLEGPNEEEDGFKGPVQQGVKDTHGSSGDDALPDIHAAAAAKNVNNQPFSSMPPAGPGQKQKLSGGYSGGESPGSGLLPTPLPSIHYRPPSLLGWYPGAHGGSHAPAFPALPPHPMSGGRPGFLPPPPPPLPPVFGPPPPVHFAPPPPYNTNNMNPYPGGPQLHAPPPGQLNPLMNSNRHHHNVKQPLNGLNKNQNNTELKSKKTPRAPKPPPLFHQLPPNHQLFFRQQQQQLIQQSTAGGK